MKKLPLGIALKSTCAFAVATLCTQAFASPEIYGQVRLSVVQNDTETKENGVVTKESKRPTMQSGNSRIGIKGSEPLTENTDLEYRLEYKVDVAEKTDGNFSARHGYLALNNKQYGKLLAGRTISYDDNLDVSPSWWYVEGSGHAFGFEADWVDNSISYTTPKLNGKTDFTIQYGMDEGNNGREFTTFKNGLETQVTRDFFIAGMSHETDNGTVGLAYTRAGDDLNAVLGSLSVDVTDKTNLGAMVQYTDYNSSKKEVGGLVALTYQATEPLGFWIEGSYADKYKGYANGENTKFSVGTTYDFNKNAMAFASVGYRDTEYGDTKEKGKGVEMGMIYKF